MFHQLDAILGPLYFWLFAGISVLCSIGLLMARHPLNGAINLIGVMLSLSGLYALLNSPFMAVLQVLVYAGAIMMLVVFVIMVLNQAKDHVVPQFDWFSLVAMPLPVALGFALVHTLSATPAVSGVQPVRGEVATLATSMFDTTMNGPGYYLLFELIGVLLLAAVVGAVVLAKRKLDSAPPTPAEHEGQH